MNFSDQTDELIKPFLRAFGKCDKKTFTKEEDTIFRTVLISLYNNIYDAHKTVVKDKCLQAQVFNKDKLKRPENYNTRYFPQEIQAYINANENQQLFFTCEDVGGREINIYFTLFYDKDHIEKDHIEKYVNYVRMIYLWLHICGQYATKNCTEQLNIFVYPTPFMKNLPENNITTMGPEHVNTAFTMACTKNNQLIIFREEEWFKVFIHETFHAYGLDFALSDISVLKKSLNSLFPLNSDFDVYEAYTETWARIINCALCSFNALEKKNKKVPKVFLENLNFCLELERMFALYQCVKVLGFMGMDYKDIHLPSEKNNLFRENTHVFSYYVLTSIFLNDYQGFILWCKKNNEVLLRFNPNATNFTAFSEYIKSIYNCIPLQNGVKYMNQMIKQMNKLVVSNGGKGKKIINTTRMSIVHTI